MDKINKITSFTIDHTKLEKGIYLSRIDGNISTYDLRFKKPNSGDYLTNSEMHTIEHLFATYARNSSISENVIYFGPMGCQTGFYFLVKDLSSEETLEHVKSILKKCIEHKGEVFGCSAIECGNYQTLELSSAVNECKIYLDILQNKNNNFLYGE